MKVTLYACKVTNITGNRITIERPLVGAGLIVPFSFDHPKAHKCRVGQIINIDLNELSRKVKRGWVHDGPRNCWHYIVGDRVLCGIIWGSTPEIAAEPTDKQLCPQCCASELFKMVKP